MLIIRELYNGSRTSGRVNGVESEEFMVNMSKLWIRIEFPTFYNSTQNMWTLRTELDWDMLYVMI